MLLYLRENDRVVNGRRGWTVTLNATGPKCPQLDMRIIGLTGLANPICWMIGIKTGRTRRTPFGQSLAQVFNPLRGSELGKRDRPMRIFLGLLGVVLLVGLVVKRSTLTGLNAAATLLATHAVAGTRLAGIETVPTGSPISRARNHVILRN